MEDKIALCITILNDTEVKGKKNLNNILAVIQLLEQEVQERDKTNE